MIARPGSDTPLTSDDFAALMTALPGETMAGPLAVAVSGGADSMALTLLLGIWCARRDIELTALTVDHGLRPESAAEARQVGQWLALYRIPHVILPWTGDKPRNNIQENARIARYRLMGAWCLDQGINRLFVAHQQGDQAETFLMRLFRGSGVDGLAGMKILSPFPVTFPETLPGALQLCRPLLSVPKTRLKATLKDKAQPWVDDPGNDNISYTRVQMRMLLRDSQITGLEENRLAGTAARMGRVQNLLQTLTDDLLAQAVTILPTGHAQLQSAVFFAGHEELALRGLARLLRRIGGQAYVPRLQRLEALYRRMQEKNFSGATLGHCVIIPAKGKDTSRIMICREPAGLPSAVPIPAAGKIIWDGRFLVINNGSAGIIKPMTPARWRRVCALMPSVRAQRLPAVVRAGLPCLVETGPEKDKNLYRLPEMLFLPEDNGKNAEKK